MTKGSSSKVASNQTMRNNTQHQSIDSPRVLLLLDVGDGDVNNAHCNETNLVTEQKPSFSLCMKIIKDRAKEKRANANIDSVVVSQDNKVCNLKVKNNQTVHQFTHSSIHAIAHTVFNSKFSSKCSVNIPILNQFGNHWEQLQIVLRVWRKIHSLSTLKNALQL